MTVKEFEHKIRTFTHRLSTGTIIVGLSGGADSVALLVSLSAVGYKCVAAHCNFMLRGTESERDMAHSEKIARSFGTDYVSIRFDVPEYMKSHKCSLETACRDLRYRWFEELRHTYDAQYIAVGHHREDNNETFFLNLLRGSGIRGLKGMRPINGNVIRPLLDFTREEIEHYLEDKGISYITDSSNLVADVARNKIRNHIMPEIRKYFPNSDNAIASTISNLYSTECFVNEMMHSEKQLWVMDEKINLSGIIQNRESADFIIFELLNEKGFNRYQCADIVRCVRSGSTGKIFTNIDGKAYCLDRGFFFPMNESDNDFSFIAEILNKTDFTPGKDKFIEFFDSSVLDGTPLTVRKWKIGDRMKPFGMKKGSRLISDIMKDAGYSLVDKDNTRLLVKGDEILWIIGLRRSAAYPVSEKSKQVVRISAVSKLPCP
ncbi:MAG: tRNA lysidine(34) synthetase TilS [Paramuribaculum sp.]|nr:tRNA lysidine(34) synthetase TilS [Paramuribaculum sp.]